MTVHSQPRVSPEACPALVLNADFRPLSYYPLSLWAWQDSIKAVFLDRVNIVSNYDKTVRSPSFEIRLPSVVSLKSYVKPSRHPAFRFNVFLRDRFSCQYCGSARIGLRPSRPPLEGRHHDLENVVAACFNCNCARAICAPARPHVAGADALSTNSQRSAQNGRRFPPNYLHESWMDYLYWDSVLEP